MKRTSSFKQLMGLALFACATNAQAQIAFDFDLGKRGAKVTEDHYGIFYEEINHAGDGGLYAELIRNRSFEDNPGNPDAWWNIGSVRTAMATENLLNIHQGHALDLTFSRPGDGIRNEGWWGINVVNGQTYKLNFWLKSDQGYSGKITAELQNEGGTGLGKTEFEIENANGEWRKYSATITATGSDPRGWFALKSSVKGKVTIDMVSLFPPTYNGHENGSRIDLTQMLDDLNPQFLRFPGGCYIEGAYANGKDNRFEWKKSIGPIEERPGHMNQNWFYRISDGQGLHEWLLLCEDLNANPMYVVNMGFGHNWQVNYKEIGPYIQEALDVVEYCNGDTTTTYGRMRAQAGHPEPFNLKYLEIGNENDWFDHYADRYFEFYKAIKSRWPDLILIVNGVWSNAYPAEIQDEHYYMSPDWFVSQYGKYDNYPRSATKVYVGEYATTINYGVLGNLNAAIGEAVFMQGMENNSDVCIMASYAPIFTHEDAMVWRPDMIRFNASMSYGTPSYYVQKMFANNIGKENIRWTESGNALSTDPYEGKIGLGTWLTSATFTDVKLTSADTIVFEGNSTPATDWQNGTGAWSMDEGTFVQSNASVSGATTIYNVPLNLRNFDLTLKATKKSGSEGFLILFNYRDEQNYTWWNLGGWGNSRHAIEQCTNGTKRVVTDAAGSLETGHEYTIRIVKSDWQVQCYLNGEKIHDFLTYCYADRKVYASASIDDETGDCFVKLVNPGSEDQPLHLSFKQGSVLSGSAEILTSANGNDENTTQNPRFVVPKESSITINSDGSIDFTASSYSVNILKLKVDNVVITPQTAPLPEPCVKYSFESGEPVDDEGLYPATLKGKATITMLEDGNHALHTGAIGGNGYLDLGAQMPKEVFAKLNDYSVSMNVMLYPFNNNAGFSWAYSIENGTSQYIGLVNGPANRDWYYEIKGTETKSLHTYALLTVGYWHNLTFTQKGDTGTIYIDGQKLRSDVIKVHPKDFVSNIKNAFIARSPYGDAIMENTFFDNFEIYDCALNQEQINLLAQTAASMACGDIYEGIAEDQDFEKLVKRVKNYVDESGNAALKTAYTNANRYVDKEMSVRKRDIYEKLRTQSEAYEQGEMEKAIAGQPADLTFLIANSSFVDGANGWHGADLPVALYDGVNGAVYGYDKEISEQFAKRFDVYQELYNLPAGVYALNASAFYRSGDNNVAYQNYQTDAPANKYAEIYLNNEVTVVSSLYSEGDSYTYDPYTFPNNMSDANSAFNTKDLYAKNEVRITLRENEPLRLGIRKSKVVPADWVAYDKFRLSYLGNDPVGIKDTFEAEGDVIRTEYFTTSGIRQARPTRGVNIVRQTTSDGSVKSFKILKVKE